jgi:hypothetical protein
LPQESYPGNCLRRATTPTSNDSATELTLFSFPEPLDCDSRKTFYEHKTFF